MNDHQLTVATPQLITTLDDMDRVAKSIAASGMFGITKPEQAITLMLICQAEGLNPIAALRRYHIIEGKPSMRADAMHGEFEARGARIIWHVRSDSVVAGTAIKDGKAIDDATRERATKRFELLWKLETLQDESKRGQLFLDIAKLSREGEETLIRTYADAEAKGLSEGKSGTKANWFTSPRQMLTARFVTEVVRLLDAGLIAGISSEIEVQDIARQERAEALRLTTAATVDQSDAPKILEIIAQHDAELATDIPDSRRKTVQGLRADLVCKLADIGIKAPTAPEPPKPTVGGQPAEYVSTAAKTVETTVLPPEEKKTAQPARQRRPAATTEAAAPADEIDMTPRSAESWEATVCHIGKLPGRMNGHTLRAIFDRVPSADGIDAQVGWFVQQKLPTATSDADRNLWAKVQEAAIARRAELTGSAPAPSTITTTTPGTPEPARQPASVKDWRDYTIESKSPDWNGKKLGAMTAEEITTLKITYLDKIMETGRATLTQKTLIANVALALADLTKSIEPEPEHKPGDVVDAEFDAEDEHTTALREAIEADKLNRNDFMTVCKANGWIQKAHQKLEDITEAEVVELTREWSDVARAVKAAQP